MASLFALPCIFCKPARNNINCKSRQLYIRIDNNYVPGPLHFCSLRQGERALKKGRDLNASNGLCHEI